MSPEDRADLDAMSRDIAGAYASAWEPACVTHAFRTPTSKIVFTMQVWIDLDAIRSPLLEMEIPADLDDVDRAIAAFGLQLAGRVGILPADAGVSPAALTGEEAFIIAESMRNAVRDGFSMALKMRAPEGMQAILACQGFGNWIPVIAALVIDAHCRLAEAKAMPVGQAFALLAAIKGNRGWTVEGTPYALRDISDETEEVTSHQSVESNQTSVPPREALPTDHLPTPITDNFPSEA